MKRRCFLSGLATAAIGSGAKASSRITRISSTPVQGRFHKFVAMNAYDQAPKGRTYEHSLIRIFAGDAAQGTGAGVYANIDAETLEQFRPLLGADPMSIYEMRNGRIVGRSANFASLLGKFKFLDGALYDLIGQITKQPAWQLIGEAVRERVEAYDGTLYFSDIHYRDRGVRAVVEECEEAVRSGYPAVKLKLGRGWKWMPKDEGRRRDIEVVKAVRRAVGPKVRIMGDPNNGYANDIDGLWEMLTETGDARLHWIEEPFPETIDGYTKLKTRMSAAGMKTLIADGENLGEPSQFAPYLRPIRLMDVVQLDIRRGGFLANVELAQMAAKAGAVSIPHNWASRIGVIMGLHLAKAVRSVPAAEDDRSTYDVLDTSGYQFRNGSYTLPDLPGLGITVDEKVYQAKYKSSEIAIT